MKKKVKMGRVFLVENKNKTASSNANYIAVQVEKENGKGETCLLFTLNEWSTSPIVDTKIPLKDGRLYFFAEGETNGYLLKTTEQYNDEWMTVIRKLTERKIDRAYDRALRNPEDLTKKSWFEDLLD